MSKVNALYQMSFNKSNWVIDKKQLNVKFYLMLIKSLFGWPLSMHFFGFSVGVFASLRSYYFVNLYSCIIHVSAGKKLCNMLVGDWIIQKR